MVEKEKDARSPYRLSVGELTCSVEDKTAWFERLVACQQEGVEVGIRPQNPRGLDSGLRRRWLNDVWNFYLSGCSFSEKERRIIKETTGPGREKHTGSSRYSGWC